MNSLRPLSRLFNQNAFRLYSDRLISSVNIIKPPIMRHASLFSRFRRQGGDGLAELMEEANRSPEDAGKQARLYRGLVEEDPQEVIRRFEQEGRARNQECVLHYLCSLYETGQLERAVPMFLRSGLGTAAETSSLGSITPSVSPAHILLGTKERPLWVQNSGASGSFGRKVGGLLNILVVGAILYSLLAMNEQRLEGMTGKVHKLFKPNPSDRVYTFADVQGCDEAKGELEDLVDFLRSPQKFNKLGARMPKGVLLVGPPGTGKTLLAKAVAGEADVPFFYASGSSFDELFVGVGSMRIRKLFEQAKAAAPSIIFIDELDAIGSKRNPRDPQHSRMSLNQLLTELDGFAEASGVIVIAATNIPEALDKALLRPGRFDKQVYVPLPDMRGRKSILSMYLEDVKLASDVDVNLLARSTPGFSGADLFRMVNQAKILASVSNEQAVTMEHLEASKDEMLMGAERKSTLIDPADRLLTAYHEGGHAIMALRTKDAVPIHKATIIPRGRALGMVTQLPEKDELSLTKSQLLARIDVAMGGRVAEELVFGPERVTTGASSDFSQAAKIARAMVCQYGMSDRIGPAINIESVEDYDMLSPAMREAIDSETQAILTASYARAKRALSDARKDLDLLAKALVEYETLDRVDIERILARHRFDPQDPSFLTS